MYKRGTTLIELLVVLIVMTALLSISVPAIISLTSPKEQLRKQARSINQLLQIARLTAMKTNQQIDILIDPLSYRITAVESGYLPPDLSVTDAVEVNSNRFSKSITLDEVIVSSVRSNELNVAVSFTPFGSSNGGGIRLEKENTSMTLICDILTGRPSVQKRTRDPE